jgi:hypothetical protein
MSPHSDMSPDRKRLRLCTKRNGRVEVSRIFMEPVTVFPLRKKWAREASIDSVQSKSAIR